MFLLSFALFVLPVQIMVQFFRCSFHWKILQVWYHSTRGTNQSFVYIEGDYYVRSYQRIITNGMQNLKLDAG